jgi:hypothetical protein
MRSRTPRWLLVGLILALGAFVSFAQDASRGNATEQKRVMRFVAFRYDTQGWVVVTPPEGGQAVKLMMTDECRKSARGPALGSRLVWVTARPGPRGIDMATSVAPFDGPKELESPTAYQFDGIAEEKVGATTVTVARLSKFEQSRSVPLATKPVRGGKPASDPALLERLKSLSAGDIVEIELQATGKNVTLIDVDKYRPTRVAEFIKSAQVPAAGGKSVPSVILRGEEGDVPYALPSSGPRAGAVSAFARKLKPGTYVRFTARDEEKPPVLRDMRPDVEVRPTAEGQNDTRLEIIATFCRVVLSSYGASAYCYVYPESNRPDDKAVIAGCRRLTYDTREQAKINLSAVEAERMKAVLDPPRIDPDEDPRLTPRERSEFQQLFRSWLQSEGEADRGRLEEQLLAGAVELSNRFRKDADLRIVTLKGMLSPEQLAAAKKLGDASLERRRD